MSEGNEPQQRGASQTAPPDHDQTLIRSKSESYGPDSNGPTSNGPDSKGPDSNGPGSTQPDRQVTDRRGSQTPPRTQGGAGAQQTVPTRRGPLRSTQMAARTDAPTTAGVSAVTAQHSQPPQHSATAQSPDTAAETATATAAKPAARPRTRKARLRLARVDPWSVMKTSFLFSIAGGIMLIVAVYVVWAVIGASGLFDALNKTVQDVIATPGDTTPFRAEDYINTNKVMGVAALLACVDVVIFTALATLGSFLYNLAATMLGGLEVTLADD